MFRWMPRWFKQSSSTPLLGRWCHEMYDPKCNRQLKGALADHDNGFGVIKKTKVSNDSTRDPVSVFIES